MKKIFDHIGRQEATEILTTLFTDYDPKDDTDERLNNIIEYLWQHCCVQLMLQGETLPEMIKVLEDIENFVESLDED